MNTIEFPKYSVLMSVYYKEKPDWFEKSIESILNQTILPSEFVIVEDGLLPEALEKIVIKYENRYKDLFKIIRLEKNMGLGPALKIGVENCSNEWIARMDSDDYSIPERCEKQLTKILNDKDLDIVGSSIAEFEGDISNVISIRSLPEKNESIKKYSKKRNPFGHPSVMLRKSKVLEAGNYRDYYLCEDYDMWVRMLRCNANCYNFQLPLVYMRIGPDFYKRRGGWKYMKTILRFKNEQLKNGYFTLADYIRSAIPHIIVCLMPNFLRDIIYRNLLRKKRA